MVALATEVYNDLLHLKHELLSAVSLLLSQSIQHPKHLALKLITLGCGIPLPSSCEMCKGLMEQETYAQYFGVSEAD